MMEDTKHVDDQFSKNDTDSLNSDLKGKQVGVAQAEATMQIGGYLIWIVVIAIFLTAYVTALDNNTM